MKLHFNKFEKIAGLFVGIALLGCLVSMVVFAAKNNWFAAKVKYVTELESADGIHSGTVIQISGLRVGAVTGIDLKANDKVAVEFEVLEKFAPKIHTDSHIQVFSPFILAEKVFDISLGEEQAILPPGSMIPASPSTDLMDLLSGKKMGQFLGSFDKMAESLRLVGTAFADPARTQSLVQTLDRLNPLVKNLNIMALEVVKVTGVANRDKHLETLLTNLAQVSQTLQTVIPSFQKEVPDLGQQLGQIVHNLNILTTEFQKLTPAIAEVAPDLPRTTKRAVEALDETVVVLKAMQRSFLLRGSVEDIRKEESRRPANTSEP